MNSSQVSAHVCAFVLRGHLDPLFTDEDRAEVLAYVKSRGMNFTRYENKRFIKFDYLDTLEFCEMLAGERLTDDAATIQGQAA